MNPATSPTTQLFREANPVWVERAKTRRFYRMARLMSGELSGFGASVKQVILDPHGRACTDGNTVWIPKQMKDDARVNSILQEAILAHEVAGHHRYTDFTVWDNKVVKRVKSGEADPALHQFVNMLEDARINHLLSQDWGGAGKMLDFSHHVFMADHKKQTTDESEPYQQAMVAMMSEAIAHEGHWFSTPEVVDFMDEVRPLLLNAIKQPDTAGIVRQAEKLLVEYRKRWPYDVHEAMNDFDGMPEMEDMDEVSEAAKEQKKQGNNAERVSRSRFSDMKKPSEAKPQSGSGSSNETAENESADGESDGESDGDESGEGDSPCGEAESTDGDGEGQSDSQTDSESQSNDGSKGNDYDDDGTFEETWAHLIEIVESDMATDEQMAKDMESDHEANVERAIDSVSTGSERSADREHQIEITAAARDIAARSIENIDRYDTHYDDVARQHRGGIVALANEIKRRIKGTDPRYEGGQRSGRLDPKQVWKLGRGSKMPSDRIFMRKAKQSKPTANVMVLIDASGSMGGGTENGSTRAECASEAAVVMSEVMSKIGFNYEIIDFNTRSGTTMRVRKSFKGRLGSIEKAAIAAPFTGSNNSDGWAVEWCLNRLKKMDGNRFLIVISDGQPAGASPIGMSADEHLIQVVNDAPKDIGLVSIGIGGMDTSPYYPNSVKVENTSQLAQEMLPVLRPVLRKVSRKA